MTPEDKNKEKFRETATMAGAALGEALKQMQFPGIPLAPLLPGAALGTLHLGVFAGAAKQLRNIFEAAARRRRILSEVIRGFSEGFDSDTPAPAKAVFARRNKDGIQQTKTEYNAP